MLVVGLSSEKQKSCAKWHSLKMKRILEVVPHRFERWLREPKTLVLPLHHGTSFVHCVSVMRCKSRNYFLYFQIFCRKRWMFLGLYLSFSQFVLVLLQCCPLAEDGEVPTGQGATWGLAWLLSEGKQMCLLSFFQILQGALDDVIALIDEAEIFVAIPEVVSDCRLQGKTQVVERGLKFLVVLGLDALLLTFC